MTTYLPSGLINRQHRSLSVAEADTVKELRIAIVHDWMTALAGSEKVVQQMLLLFPNADLFTLVDHLPAKDRGFLKGKVVKTSFLQTIPFSAKLFRKFLWILPSAIESLDVSGYDIVLSSSHAVAKGVLTGPNQLHICYCHTPMRYAWDLQHEYLRQAGLHRGMLSIYARATLHYMRMWDMRTAQGVDHFIANSSFISRRIRKVYGRQSTIIHPPVDVDLFSLESVKSDYYLTASRLVPYKRVDLICQAFAHMPNRKLVVVGEGPELTTCKKLAGPNIEFVGYQEDAALRDLMGRAKAFVFAAEEDFGIAVVEAQACGTPVICFNRGGVLDSVLPDQTGVFFESQSFESIVDAVDRFENAKKPLDPKRIRSHSEQFSCQHFRSNLLHVIEQLWKESSVGIHSRASEIEDPPILPARASV